MAEENVVRDVTGAPSGFAGPIGLNIPIYADQEIKAMSNFVVGANEADMHLTGVCLSDFNVVKFADIRRAQAGDPCPHCGAPYEEHRGIEVGQVFYLGTKYSKPMKAVFLDEKGESKVIYMGCYGIGIGRTAAAAIEQNHDEHGIIWPLPIAPFHVQVIPLSVDEDVLKVSEDIYQRLCEGGVEVLIDDRDLRAGVKFADADLIGIPYRIVVGAKGLKDGVVEIKERKGGDAVRAKPIDAVQRIVKIVSELKNSK